MPNIQIKRYTGTAWENLNPKTLAQNLYNAAGDTQIFDGSDKIKVAYLPDAVFDSLYFYTTVATSSNLRDLANAAVGAAASANRSALGFYWVATAGLTLSANTGSTLVGSYYYTTILNPSEEGTSTSTSSVTVEAGDWVVISKITGSGTSGDPYAVTFATVNNTYETATTSVFGITRLSNATTYASLSGNDVVTEGVLKTTIDNASFASSSHTHLLAAGATDVTATASEVNILDGALITTTELNYLDGVTSAIQTQLNGKAATSHTHTVANITDLTATASELNVLDGITATVTELNYTDGVTSNIQTQLDGKASTSHTHAIGDVTGLQTALDGKQATITGGATSITSSNLTASRALVSDGSGKVAVSSVTSTELGYLSGVTSAIQTQLNTLAGRVQVFYDGTPSGMVTNDLWFDAV